LVLSLSAIAVKTASAKPISRFIYLSRISAALSISAFSISSIWKFFITSFKNRISTSLEIFKLIRLQTS